MKHLMKCIGYMVMVALFLCAFDTASDVAFEAVKGAMSGDNTVTTAIYAVLAALGIVWLGCEVFHLYSKYMAGYAGKPLLEKYQKELEANWAGQKKAIEDKIIEYADTYEQYRIANESLSGQLGRVTNDLQRSRFTAINLEKELIATIEKLKEANEELKVLRGPLELSEADANA